MEKEKEQESVPLTRAELLGHLQELINAYDKLPQGALLQPVNHGEFHSILMLLSALFKFP